LAGGVGAVNQVADLLDDPQVTERASLLPVDDSDLRVLAGPVRFGGVPQAALAQPPELGADSDEVLREAGFSDAEIQTLRADAVTP
ncbi:MAG TPA: CoA transferase, partial [Acidimicrobiales bacterium]